MKRVHNFNPGPAALPMEVLKTIQEEMLDYRGTGMSILEMSHRSKEFEGVLNNAKTSIRNIMNIPETHEIIFTSSGGSLQFAMVPMNFLGDADTADYVCTGSWAKKAIKEAKLFGNVNVVGTSEADKFSHIPENSTFSPNARYVHITTNNTIFGTQWQSFPDTKDVPLIADMSSDFYSRRFDVSRFGLIYAGAQKNIGPAGVTVVIIRKNMLERVVSRKIPTMLLYKTYVDENSLYNTPPVFAIYTVGLTAQWIEKAGGIDKIEEMNKAKAKLLYDTIDAFPKFYLGTVKPGSRSAMNATFRLPKEELEKDFLQKAGAASFVGLKGHRSVGGVRVSMYNAVALDSIEKLTAFMKDYAKSHA